MQSCLYFVHRQDAGGLDAGIPPTLSFLFIPDPKLWDVALHIQGGFSLLN